MSTSKSIDNKSDNDSENLVWNTSLDDELNDELNMNDNNNCNETDNDSDISMKSDINDDIMNTINYSSKNNNNNNNNNSGTNKKRKKKGDYTLDDIKYVFNFLDESNKKHLTVENILNGFKKIQHFDKITPKLAQEMLNYCDKFGDNDGRIMFYDFKNICSLTNLI